MTEFKTLNYLGEVCALRKDGELRTSCVFRLMKRQWKAGPVPTQPKPTCSCSTGFLLLLMAQLEFPISIKGYHTHSTHIELSLEPEKAGKQEMMMKCVQAPPNHWSIIHGGIL